LILFQRRQDTVAAAAGYRRSGGRIPSQQRQDTVAAAAGYRRSSGRIPSQQRQSAFKKLPKNLYKSTTYKPEQNCLILSNPFLIKDAGDVCVRARVQIAKSDNQKGARRQGRWEG
jgi:hypothetical protein